MAEKKRGRPKKVTAVNEEDVQLNMERTDRTKEIDKMIDNLPSNRSLNVEYKTVNQQRENIMNDNGYAMFNPFTQNTRLKRISTLPRNISREKLTEMVANPAENEDVLRGVSQNMAFTQQLYNKVMRMYGDIPLYKHYKVPEYYPASTYKKADFIAEDEFVDDWIKTFDVVNLFKRISLEVAKEGKCAYLLRNSVTNDTKRRVNFCTLQKLPPEYIKITGIGRFGYTVSLNLVMFQAPGFSPDQYPKIIGDLYRDVMENKVLPMNNKGRKTFNVTPEMRNYKFAYNGGVLKSLIEEKSGKGFAFWVELPQEICYVISQDASTPWMLPNGIGMFNGLEELKDYDALAGLLQSTPLNAVLTAEIEPVKNPLPGQDQTIMNPETIAAFEDHFNQSTSTNIEAMFAPLKNFQLHALPEAPGSSEVSTNATRAFIYRNGLGGIIPTTDKPSVSQVKASELLMEGACDYVTRQLETVTNFIINNLIGCKYKWQFHVWGNLFTYDEECSRDKELWSAGATFMLPKIASAQGFTMRDVGGIDNYIDSLKVYDELKTITHDTMLQDKEISAGEGTNPVGRPKKSDSQVDNDNTAASKESGLDTAETRDTL